MSKLPETLLNVNENTLLKRILDRSNVVDDVATTLHTKWSTESHSENFNDFAILMMDCLEENVKIEIPENYKSFRPQIKDEYLAETEKRSGILNNLNGNKDLFSFSIQIFDESIQKTRKFNITDPYGNLNPVLIEPDFLKNSVPEIFVNTDRWTKIYEQTYFLTKILIDRLSDESKNMFAQIKTMKKELELPVIKKEWDTQIKEDGKSVQFKSLEIEVDAPKYTNKYKMWDTKQDNLDFLICKRNKYIYSVIPKLRYMTRCVELAFFNHDSDRLPSWIGKDVKWENNFKFPKKRIAWDILNVGKFSLRKRVKSKKETVCKNFEIIA
jgi:hypothetical protein